MATATHAAFERDRVTGCWFEDETALDLSTAPHRELQLRSRQSYHVNRPHGAGNEDVTVILNLHCRARRRPRLIAARTQRQETAEFSNCIFDDHARRSAGDGQLREAVDESHVVRLFSGDLTMTAVAGG